MRDKWNWLVRMFNACFIRRASFWTLVFSAVLAFLTFQIRDIYKLINQTTESSERAFLTFMGPQNGPRLVENTSDSSSPWSGQEIEVTWANSGNTPAREVLMKANAQPFFPDLPSSFDFPLAPTSKAVVAMGPHVNYSIPLQIPKTVLSDAWHGKKAIVIWGTAIYRDVFPDSPERLSEFCVELTHLTIMQASSAPTTTTPQTAHPNTPSVVPTPIPSADIDNPTAALGGFAWQQCQQHNCYDADCADYKDRIGDMRK